MGKAKLICQQTDKISQQPEDWETTMALNVVFSFISLDQCALGASPIYDFFLLLLYLHIFTNNNF
jgi:hypothetical protein